MGIFSPGGMFTPAGDDMAKRATTRTDVNQELVSSFVDRLVVAGLNKELFDRVFGDLKASKDLAVVDVIAISHRYIGGGIKPGSKAAALTAISKRFVERVRADAKGKIAEKVRPW